MLRTRLSTLFGSLRTVLMVQVALPVLMVLALMLIVGQNLISQFIEERMQRDLQLITRAIHLPVSQALKKNDIEQIESSLASVFGMTEVYGAYLFDADGRRLVSFGVVNPTRRQATEALELTLDGEFAQYERIKGRKVYSFFLPLFDLAGQPSGLLQVTRKRSDIDKSLAELRYWAWGGFAVVSLLILGILALTHQRAIGHPLERLLRTMQRIEAGEKYHRASQQGPAEVKKLAAGLNEMLDAIAQAEKRENAQRQARAQMAEKLRQTETLAALGQLSAGVAHELGAPLSVVDGRANRLLRRARDQQDRRELEDIRHQVARMTSIIKQLLFYGRSSRAPKRMLDVDMLVKRARRLLSEEGRQHIELISGSAAQIEGDALSIEQALINLLRNACQACPDGKVILGWEADRVARKLILYVEDAGSGIDPALRPQIFEPFVTTKIPGEGSGLGLAIVQRVMREHQGSAQVKDSSLGGARFELVFPLPRAQSVEST
ncbi:HAMP domain-containing protein [Nitrosomonas nitrosa]|uniref:sensor histidine kinase n=1 Tax=Nitrosomonas nitrosa TaxID=52442 RepID=UPI000D322683|nr:HAMP domain-containing sensor histidine kinase [Nitrosomonas nitrosa]PTQ92028.1 HAMP domain-containing protein [Nitrosomonas nitrosa]